MAIIYSYPELPFNKLTGDDLFVVTDADSVTDNPTRSLSLDNVVKYIKESAGSGTGTANVIPKFKTTGASVLEDSIVNELVGSTGINVAGSLEITNKGTSAATVSGDGNTTLTTKGYVDSLVARKLFTATSLDTTTNYNTAGVQTPIVWDSELIKDSIYTHDSGNTPTQVTVTEAGTYRVYSMLTATSPTSGGTAQRTQVILRIAVNGTSTARQGRGMYLRSASGHQFSSATIEETMELSVNDIITITGERGSSAAAVINAVASASFFSIEKIA